MAATCSSRCDYEHDFPNGITDDSETVPHATTTSDIYNGFYIPKGISEIFTRPAHHDIVRQGRPSLETFGMESTSFDCLGMND